jgi:16S rRNA (cytosine967-C5)-methyltransferase
VTVSTLPAADARRSALRILDLVAEGATFDAARDRAVEGLGERDRRLAHELAAGVLRQQQRLDDALSPHVARGIGSVQPRLRRILELGAYQLTALDRVPAHAAVSVCVELARDAGGERAAGFVNAVLRKVGAGKALNDSLTVAGGREGGKDMASGGPVDPAGLARTWSHPSWLVERWVKRFGPAETEALLQWNNTKPPLVIQPARASLPELYEQFEAAGIPASPAPFGAGLVVGVSQPRDLPGYEAGEFVVQDAAQALVVRYADLPEGCTVLDACAAPGGKAIALGRVAGRVLACDRSRERVARLATNLARAGSGYAWPVVALAEQPPVRGVDAVLLDAPCLGTGTFARHPDARHRVEPGALRELAARQRMLLDGVARAVRVGGLLVYATCSLEPEENEEQVDRFLAGHPGFRREPSTAVPPELRSAAGDLLLLPQRHGTDGAFAARLRRSA